MKGTIKNEKIYNIYPRFPQFQVKVNNSKKIVQIYKIFDDKEKPKLFKTFKFKKIYTPENNYCKTKKKIKNVSVIKNFKLKIKESEFKGNTIMLDLGKNRFVFIGYKIFEFKLEPNDIFEKYYAPISKKNEVYPIIKGKNNLYFLDTQDFYPRGKFHNSINKNNWCPTAKWATNFLNMKLIGQNKPLRNIKIFI